MAIYQPSNVAPSTFAGAGGGTIESTDNISVSWQVNGNSPLLSFQIDFYENNAVLGKRDTSELSSYCGNRHKQ